MQISCIPRREERPRVENGVDGARLANRRSVQASGASHERIKSWMFVLSGAELQWHLRIGCECLRSDGYKRPVISVLSVNSVYSREPLWTMRCIVPACFARGQARMGRRAAWDMEEALCVASVRRAIAGIADVGVGACRMDLLSPLGLGPGGASKRCGSSRSLGPQRKGPAEGTRPWRLSEAFCRFVGLVQLRQQ